MTKEDQVIKSLLADSIKQTWLEAKHEWELITVYKSEEQIQCLCKTPITYVCVIENGATLQIKRIGSCCYDNIFNTELGSQIVKSLNRIYERNHIPIDTPTLRWLKNMGYTNQKGYAIYADIRDSAKRMTPNQQSVITEHNNKFKSVLSKMTYIHHKIFIDLKHRGIFQRSKFLNSIQDAMFKYGTLTNGQSDALLKIASDRKVNID